MKAEQLECREIWDELQRIGVQVMQGETLEARRRELYLTLPGIRHYYEGLIQRMMEYYLHF
jgi:hypothetical protein